MKKVVLLLAAALGTSFAFAQVGNVKKARKADFSEAKQLIEAAQKDETTKNSAETWYVGGLIYAKQWEKEDDKRFEIPPQQPNVDLQSECAYNAFQAWIVADSLDALEAQNNPKRKGKLEYRKEISKKLATMKEYINNYGNIAYNKDNFALAFKAYSDFMSLPNLEMFKGTELINANDSSFIFANENAELTLRRLYVQQKQANDEAAALKTLELAVKKYPNNSFFLTSQIDYNLKHGKIEQAVNDIQTAINLNPNNPTLYWVRGFIFKAQNKIPEAKADLEKAISLKPDYADAIADYGLLIKLDADSLYEKGSFSKSNAEAAVALKEADEKYKESISYLEKARTLQGDRVEDMLLQNLQGMYRKLKMFDKEKEIRKARGLE
ncbi:MAG: tetratricopeptide repeat protein [Prevotellaceae bacterium]|jgi:tetratricopeptide (TPR) repeat protein|nr:tetratricopeptide repeat protein [Prevotellaceae bacterium]